MYTCAFGRLICHAPLDYIPRLQLFLFDNDQHLQNQKVNQRMRQFWQVEYDDDSLSGLVVDWGDLIRLRHMTTKRYLSGVKK